MSPAPATEKFVPEVFGSVANAICPKCGHISLPHFTGSTTAVMCQNPGCKHVAEKDAPVAAAPAAEATVEEAKPAGTDSLTWLRFAANTAQRKETVEAQVKQLTRAERIFRQNAETGVPFDRTEALRLLSGLIPGSL